MLMSKIRKPDKSTVLTFRRTFALFNILTCVISLTIIGICYYYFYISKDLTPSFYQAIILFGVLTISTAGITYLVFLPLLRNLGVFEETLNKVSGGKYDARIPEEKLGVFKTMGSNFNKMVDELEQNKLLNREFVHNFSHEFKTPISSINGFATVLLEEDLSEKDRIKYLKIIKEESFRLAHLSEKVLFLSKLNSQSIITDKKEYSLNEQIKNAVIITQKFWEDKNIKIEAIIRDVKYNSNPELINEIWINLLSNAIKYTPENGTIGIKLTKRGNKVIFTIADNGVGIEPEKLNYIFNEYYQADSSRNNMGVGLGLSIVKKIVDLAGGTIEVESEINKGTKFIITL